MRGIETNTLSNAINYAGVTLPSAQWLSCQLRWTSTHCRFKWTRQDDRNNLKIKEIFHAMNFSVKEIVFSIFSLKLNKACTVSSSICLTSVCISEPSIYGIKTPNKKFKAAILLKKYQNLIAQEYLLKLDTAVTMGVF